MHQDISKEDTSSEATSKLTRVLLSCGVVAGPLYVILVFSVAVVLGWAWISVLAAKLLTARA